MWAPDSASPKTEMANADLLINPELVLKPPAT